MCFGRFDRTVRVNACCGAVLQNGCASGHARGGLCGVASMYRVGKEQA